MNYYSMPTYSKCGVLYTRDTVFVKVLDSTVDSELNFW